MTVRSLLVMGSIGACLTAYNLYISAHERSLALGPPSRAQEAFFVDAADQPDINIFFRKLSEVQKVRMARNIGRYGDPALAKLCGILLGDFSSEARAALTISLSRIARLHPLSVVEQLDRRGSFEEVGIREALFNAGSRSFPSVVNALSDDAREKSAEDFLVSAGRQTAPLLLPLLDRSHTKEALAAARVLGKLRSRASVPALTRNLSVAKLEEKQVYISALASIGDPSSAKLLSSIVDDPDRSSGTRAEAALGLGSTGSNLALTSLGRNTTDRDEEVVDACISGLAVFRDRALKGLPTTRRVRLAVAARYLSALSDQVIAAELKRTGFQREAAKACHGRTTLVEPLIVALRNGQFQNDGQAADTAIASLLSTSLGQRALQSLCHDPVLYGLIARRLSLAKIS